MKYIKLAVIIALLAIAGSSYAGIPDCEGGGDKIQMDVLTLQRTGDRNILTVQVPSGYTFDSIDVWPALHDGEDLASDCTHQASGIWTCEYSEMAEGYEDIVVVDLMRGTGTGRCVVAWAKSFVDEILISEDQISDKSAATEEVEITGQSAGISRNPETASSLEEEMYPEDELSAEAEIRELGAADVNEKLMGAGGGSCSLNPDGNPNLLAFLLFALMGGLITRLRRFTAQKS
jgi:hypothetical protein